MAAAWRQARAWVWLVLAAALALVCLQQLAITLTTRGINHDAANALSANAAGQSPWQWHFAHADDVVAGRAFGAATLERTADGLGVRSRDGSAWEIGLPMPRDADLERLPQLAMQLQHQDEAKLWLLLRRSAQAPLCMAPVPAGAPSPWLLATLHWQQADATPCPVPDRAAMLRLRARMPAGATLILSAAALQPEAPLQVAAPVPLPHGSAAAAAVIARTLAASRSDTLPLLQLPPARSPQTLLALRELAWQRAPGAVVVAAGTGSGVSAALAWPPWVHWMMVSIYATALLVLVLGWRRPWRAWRPVAEIAGCLSGPLWLIVGMQLGHHTAPADAVMFLLGLGFAAWLGWRDRPAQWRWWGPPGAFAAALALLPVAVALWLLAGHALQPPPPSRMLVYLAWAALQQWLMLAIVLGRLQRLLPWPPAALLACAVLFALLHTPNLLLMQLCLLAELFWAWCFLRWRALLPVALAHAACALLLQAGLAGGWLRSLEVSARFLLAP